jgi:hypothetical protein
MSIVFLATGIDGCKRKNTSSKTSADAKSVAESTCNVDEDCLLIRADCCGCLHGGKQIAISKSAAKTYDDTLDKKCAGTVCAQMISTDASCQKVAKCTKGLCELHEINY